MEPISDDRYEITPVNGELTVEKALLQVSCRNESSVVGQEPTTDYEMYIEGFVNGEDKSVIDQMPTITLRSYRRIANRVLSAGHRRR